MSQVRVFYPSYGATAIDDLAVQCKLANSGGEAEAEVEEAAHLHPGLIKHTSTVFFCENARHFLKLISENKFCLETLLIYLGIKMQYELHILNIFLYRHSLSKK